MVGIVFFCYGAGSLLYLWVLKAKERKAMTWPSVKGRVVSTDVIRECEAPAGKCFKPIVRYSYTVRDRTYESDGFGIGRQYTAPHVALAERRIARYPVGSEVTVYYDPEDPKAACLQRSVHNPRSLLIMSGISFLLALLFFLGAFQV